MLTKDDVKTLAAGDKELSFWCAVLFGEICGLVARVKAGYKPVDIWPLVECKVQDFEALVQQRMVKVALAKVEAAPTLEERVTKLEAKVFA